MKLGILAVLASFHFFPASEEPATFTPPVAESAEHTPSGEPAVVRNLGLLQAEQGERRGETICLDTPVGRVEVMLLWSDAQLQLGLLEEPLDEAVVAFAPAGTFSRKERPTGRVVLSLPILRF